MADPSDQELLNLVFQERRQSVGLDNDAVLSQARIRSLEYFQGQMDDLPALPHRSQAVSTDVADAIETALPDLVDIFVGGSDVASFRPQNESDVEAAQQESDYINHVVVQENDGFRLFYASIKDALTVKIGVYHWWWEHVDRVRQERFELIPQDQFEIQQSLIEQADQEAEITDVETIDDPVLGPLVNYVVRYNERYGRARVRVIPPEDFTVSRDTVDLKETPYCAMRSRIRAQDLVAEGYDPELVAMLPPYGAPSYMDAVQVARDTAGEQTQLTAGTVGDLRMVEIVQHFIRIVDPDSGEPVLWRVVTGNDERTMLDRNQEDRVRFSAITPFPVPHRFYGLSLSDRLMDIQRINSALTRMLLDSGYFALNQRVEVSEAGQNEFTISDLLNNIPGAPIRTKTGEAVRPIQSGAISFDVLGAIEYINTSAEKRTGIVRNAQGLNPDTLHDTAQGAMALMSNAQKRVRLMARNFAETGIKDMFLGVHALIRTHCEKPEVTRLRGKWVTVDPTKWGDRDDMCIEIGIGSGGQQHELQAGQAVLSVLQEVVQLQEGAEGPIVNIENAYNAVKRFLERGWGIKGVDQLISDPSNAPPQPPKPNPEMQKLQQQGQLEQFKAQQQAQSDQQKAAFDQQAAQAKLQQELVLAREKMAQERDLALQQMQIDRELKMHEMELDYRAKLAGAPPGWGNMTQVSQGHASNLGGVVG